MAAARSVPRDHRSNAAVEEGIGDGDGVAQAGQNGSGHAPPARDGLRGGIAVRTANAGSELVALDQRPRDISTRHAEHHGDRARR
jgi:hypothetical protein